MVKVLPEPVTPSSTWSRSPARDAVEQLGDRLRLVARGLEIRGDPEGDSRVLRGAFCDGNGHAGNMALRGRGILNLKAGMGLTTL